MSTAIFLERYQERLSRFQKRSTNVSAALIFGKERCVSGARKNDERAESLLRVVVMEGAEGATVSAIIWA